MPTKIARSFVMLINPFQSYLRFPPRGAPEDDVHYSRLIPAAYKPYLFPFSDAWMERSSAADILHQVLNVNGYTICSHLFIAHTDIVLEPRAEAPLHLLHFTLKGSIRCHLAGRRSVWLRAGQFGCFRLQWEANGYWLEKGRVYETFHIDISPGRLSELAVFHDAFRLLGHTDAAHPYVDAGAGIMPASAYAHIDAIRQLSPSAAMHRLAAVARIDLLIAETLAATDPAQSPEALQGDAALFPTIRAYMLHHLSEPLLNTDIATAYCISESKLKSGFRKRFGESPQSWLRRVRMETASELIRNSAHTLHQIAEMVGYMDYGNFSRRFHAHYGHPPSYLKRQ